MTDQREDKGQQMGNDQVAPKASPSERDADDTQAPGGRGTEEEVVKEDTRKFREASD